MNTDQLHYFFMTCILLGLICRAIGRVKPRRRRDQPLPKPTVAQIEAIMRANEERR